MAIFYAWSKNRRPQSSQFWYTTINNGYKSVNVRDSTEDMMQWSLMTHTHTHSTQTAYLLADGSIACKDVGILKHCQVWRSVRSNLQHTAPLGKPSTVLVVVGTAICQAIQPYQHHTDCAVYTLKTHLAYTEPFYNHLPSFDALPMSLIGGLAV